VRSVVARWHEIKRAEGPKRHSPSKAFRRELVDAWNRVLLKTPTRPSGRLARTSAPGRRRG
jgi:hypothetical protein